VKVRLLERDYVVPGAAVGSEHDVSESEAALLFERGLAEAVKPPAPARSATPGESWTVKDLQAHAAEAGIDLGTARTKAEILAVINAPPKEPEGGEKGADTVGNDGEGGGGEGGNPPAE
jgi:hypothetical protein